MNKLKKFSRFTLLILLKNELMDEDLEIKDFNVQFFEDLA